MTDRVVDTLPSGEDMAVRLAAYWRAILLSQPHRMQLSELVRLQLPLMAKALGVQALAVPLRIQDMETALRPKEDPGPFAVSVWTLYVDFDEGQPWACGMVALSASVIKESYIGRGRPNLFHQPYVWAQVGVHEDVQDNFLLPSYWLSKIRRIVKGDHAWYDRALAAHVINALRLHAVGTEPEEADLEARYHEWASLYELDVAWPLARDLASAARRERLAVPCQVVPLHVLRERPEGMGVQDAIWEYLAAPEQGFGLSKRAAADILSIPYSTLSSRLAHRKAGRSEKAKQTRSSRKNAERTVLTRRQEKRGGGDSDSKE